MICPFSYSYTLPRPIACSPFCTSARVFVSIDISERIENTSVRFWGMPARVVSPMWCIRIQEYKITGWGTHSMERFRSPDQPLPHSCTELRSTCAGPGILESASSIDRGWWTEMILFSCRQNADLRSPITEHPGSPQSLPIHLGATIMAFI